MSEWQPIETAPAVGAGEFLVRGGTLESDLWTDQDYTVAHVTRERDWYDKEKFSVCNLCYYDVWATNPTEWKPI